MGAVKIIEGRIEELLQILNNCNYDNGRKRFIKETLKDNLALLAKLAPNSPVLRGLKQ